MRFMGTTQGTFDNASSVKIKEHFRSVIRITIGSTPGRRTKPLTFENS
jgi:hypothetical protein